MLGWGSQAWRVNGTLRDEDLGMPSRSDQGDGVGAWDRAFEYLQSLAVVSVCAPNLVAMSLLGERRSAWEVAVGEASQNKAWVISGSHALSPEPNPLVASLGLSKRAALLGRISHAPPREE